MDLIYINKIPTSNYIKVVLRPVLFGHKPLYAVHLL